MKHKNHEESDLQCNFSRFRNYIPTFYHKIFFIILILRALDLFLFQAWGGVVVSHHARPKQR